MQKSSILLIFLSFLSLSAFSQIEKKVLFIGNSYTGVNNLPLIVNNMTESAGDILIYDSNSPGGVTLEGHSTNATTLQKIGAGDWDYVVLQEQSQLPSFPQGQVETSFYPFAEALCDTIRALNDCAEPMFYMTWGRENGDQANCQFAPWLCTYEGMDDSLRSRYTHAAETNQTELAPAGAVWRYIRENHPEINLYSGDGSHPSLAGSYAVACTFYATIFDKDPNLITWNSTLPESVTTSIKNAAKTIVYDDLASWNFTVNPALANFTEVIDNNNVAFTNTSTETDSLIWNFGDGATSMDENPIHTYFLTGTYEVLLINYKCGESDTLSKTITIDTAVDVENTNSESFIKLFPNPTKEYIQITLADNNKNVKFTIFDLAGKVLISKAELNSDSTINISNLSNGLYILKVEADGKVYSRKIQKVS